MDSPAAASMRWCSSTSKLRTVWASTPDAGLSGCAVVSTAPGPGRIAVDIRRSFRNGGGWGDGRSTDAPQALMLALDEELPPLQGGLAVRPDREISPLLR